MRKNVIAYILFCMVMAMMLTASAHANAKNTGAHPVKVLIVSMFAPEGKVWLDHLGPMKEIKVAGLSPDYPALHCTPEDVCVVTTGMGQSNAAATMSILLFSRQFDFSKTYILVTGIAGIDPAQGTLGSAAWARYLVDFDIQWEIDAREIPADWKSGFLGINTKSGNEKPPLDYKTEVFRLNEALLQKALALSKNVTLTDSEEAKAYRAKYSHAPANQPPTVIQCDTLDGNTWFSGNGIGQRARDWVRLLTDGQGTYCTTQQEDNSTFEAVKRAASAGLADTERVAVLRSGSDFDRPYEGGSNVDNLLDYQAQGGFVPAIENLYLTGSPLVHAIVKDWQHWKNGVPKN